jgi:hypothetical protein
VVTLIGVFIPFNPKMPDTSLDTSWQYAMNEAVARHLSIGTQIIFTYGPYSSLSTQFYDPSTDTLILWAGLLLALSYAALLLYLARNACPWLLPVFLLYVAGFMLSRDPLSVSRDALFFSYPLLLVACVASYLDKPSLREDKRTAALRLMATAFVITPLGLLPLIKGTYLILCGITIIGIFAQLLYRRQARLAFIVLICPIAATLLFWKISGQAISNLPAYFTSMSPIVSGYSEAMARQIGWKAEIRIFLVAAFVLIFSIAATRKLSPSVRAFLAVYLTFFLFVAFKSGFVRHDIHALIGGCSVLLAAILTTMLFVDRTIVIALALSFIAWFSMDKNHVKTSTYSVYDNLSNVYLGLWDRPPFTHARRHFLHHEFDHDLAEIKQESPVPDLHGSVDIYPVGQASILASNNTWNPRPIFQSYSAYTPALAAINEQHLRGDTAPDNILFSIDPLDMRLPSIEDGPSWPALFDNYTVANFDEDAGILYLRRKPVIHAASRFLFLENGPHHTNESVAVPRVAGPIFAQLDIEPTFLGTLAGMVFTYPQLTMDVTLDNGKIRSYHVPSNMLRAGFLLTPLITDTNGFNRLMESDATYLRRNTVASIKLIPRSGNGTLWNSTYTLKLEAWQPPAR